MCYLLWSCSNNILLFEVEYQDRCTLDPIVSDGYLFSPHVLWQYPVYFTFEDSNIEAVLADIKRNDATGQSATATTGG